MSHSTPNPDFIGRRRGKAKENNMSAAKKGSCGGTPRVGKKGDPKPSRGGRGRGAGRRSK